MDAKKLLNYKSDRFKITFKAIGDAIEKGVSLTKNIVDTIRTDFGVMRTGTQKYKDFAKEVAKTIKLGQKYKIFSVKKEGRYNKVGLTSTYKKVFKELPQKVAEKKVEKVSEETKKKVEKILQQAPDTIKKKKVEEVVNPEKLKVLKSVKGGSSVSSFVNRFLKVADNILSKGGSRASIMLVGDPGTGKTSFVRNLAILTGLNELVIEAPHITEEHVINIPYVFYKGKQQKGGIDKIDDTKVGYAKSSLLVKLMELKPVDDKTWMNNLKKNRFLYKVYLRVEPLVKRIREEGFKTILFVDEFFRVGSTRVQNILRGILDGKIGNDRIPDGVYVMYASNNDFENDEGLEEQTFHQQFLKEDMNFHSKEEWFGWLQDQFFKEAGGKDKKEGETVVVETGPLKAEVFNAFKDILSDNFAEMDNNSGVRISYRRMEQILLFISESLPVKNQKQAEDLLKYVQINYTNPFTGEKHKDYNKIMETVVNLIKETSGINVSPNKVTASSDWRNWLDYALDVQAKLGSYRKNVLVLSGLPGIGKTATVKDLVKSKGVGVYTKNCTELSEDDILGIGVPEERGNENKRETIIKFTNPPLFNDIMKAYNEYKKQTKDFKESGSIGGNYHFVVFLDELNRVKTPKIFNSLRRLLLEKQVNEDEKTKLPDDVMVISAINPYDIGESTIEFTPHTMDVLDVLNCAPNWDEFIEWVRNSNAAKQYEFDIKDPIEILIDALQIFVSDFQAGGRGEVTDAQGNPISIKEQPFWWEVEGEKFYISPRDYYTIIDNTLSGIENRFELLADWLDKGLIKPEEVTNERVKKAHEVFVQKINMQIKDVVERANQIADINARRKIVNLITGFVKTNKAIIKTFDGFKTMSGKIVMNVYEMIKEFDFDFSKFNDEAIRASLVNILTNDNANSIVGDINKALMEYDKEKTDGSIVIKWKDVYDKFKPVVVEVRESSSNKDLINTANQLIDMANMMIKDSLKYISTRPEKESIINFFNNDNYFKEVENSKMYKELYK